MEVIFRSKRLRRNYEESASATRQWGPLIARKYITRINELYALKDFRQAFGIRAMRLHPLKGSRRGELSIHLTGQWRLIVMKGDADDQVIVKEVSNHYDD